MSKTLVVKGMTECIECPLFDCDDPADSLPPFPVTDKDKKWYYCKHASAIDFDYDDQESPYQPIPEWCPLPDEAK